MNLLFVEIVEKANDKLLQRTRALSAVHFALDVECDHPALLRSHAARSSAAHTH